MSNIRLYYPNSIVENTTSLLSKEHTHYVANVMRLKRGSNINFFNKGGEWVSEIVFLEKDRIEVKFLNRLKKSVQTSSMELAICLVKKLNLERAKKIVIEATEQSNQLSPPEISKITKLKDFVNNLNETSKLFFADINSKDKLKKEDIKGDNLKTILIGPEGDFTPNERKMILENKNTISFSLSKNILKTETATISALSLVSYSNDL